MPMQVIIFERKVIGLQNYKVFLEIFIIYMTNL